MLESLESVQNENFCTKNGVVVKLKLRLKIEMQENPRRLDTPGGRLTVFEKSSAIFARGPAEVGYATSSFFGSSYFENKGVSTVAS